MAYSVAARTREIGVRVALGAQPKNVFGMVVRQGMGAAAAGLTLGLLGAAALGKVLTSLLYGVKPTDVFTFVGVAGVLLSVITIGPASGAGAVASAHAGSATTYEVSPAALAPLKPGPIVIAVRRQLCREGGELRLDGPSHGPEEARGQPHDHDSGQGAT